MKVIQKPLIQIPKPNIPFHPPPSFVEKIERLRRENSSLIRILAESLMLSMIVATKRVIGEGEYAWREPLYRQLIEYARMKREKGWSVDILLAYEARVANQYWRAYKNRLRAVGLDFRSRVRDRFVREFVESARARARGYSPANAAINYLHQRRLAQCRLVNAALGIGWIGCEGLLHVAERKPPIGLLLDLSDPFKLADREKFLGACLRFQITAQDFVSKIGRQRIRFYFPAGAAIDKLEGVGILADQSTAHYDDQDVTLTKAYEKYARSFQETVESLEPQRFRPFVYGLKGDQDWIEQALKDLVD